MQVVSSACAQVFLLDWRQLAKMRRTFILKKASADLIQEERVM